MPLIACATDRRYVQLVGALLASIAARGDVPDARLVVIGLGLTHGDRRRLRRSAGALAERITFLDGAACLARLPPWRLHHHFTVAVYLRLFLPELLAPSDERLVYLDADMLVQRSLRPLFDLDLGGHALAAVRERGIPQSRQINAGLLVIDMAEWRRRQIAEKCLAYAHAHNDELKWFDQDALNAVLGDDWLALDATWNLHDSVGGAGQFQYLPLEAYANAAIVHFVGHIKPSSSECGHPMAEAWRDTSALTPWRRRPQSNFERRMRKIAGKRWRKLRRLLGHRDLVLPS